MDDHQDNVFNGTDLRERLSRFSIRPWEMGDMGWRSSYISECLVTRYLKAFKRSHSATPACRVGERPAVQNWHTQSLNLRS